MDAKECEKALVQTKIDLLRRNDTAFIRTVCFGLKHVFDERVPTAGTDGKVVVYNPEFFMGLSKADRLAVMLHETWHPVLDHCNPNLKKFGYDLQIANQAMDYLINYMLVKQGHTFFDTEKDKLTGKRKYCYDPERFTDEMHWKEIYDVLIKEPKQDKAMGGDVQFSNESPEEHKERMDKIISKAAMQAVMEGEAGSIPGDIKVRIDALTKPKLNWDTILRRLIKTHTKKEDYSFLRPNRRFMSSGIYLPSLYSESLGDAAAAYDMSNSVSDSDTTKYVSETQSVLAKVDNVNLLQFDTRVFDVTKIKNLEHLKSIEFKGRGGTYIDPVMEWAKENKPSVLLIFTDGYFSPPAINPKVPVVWIVHDNPTFTAPFGEVIQFN